MKLQDDIDFTTLNWVKQELDETLKQARQALEVFVEDPVDTSQMRFCATYLHQVQGTLRMVELYGAGLVVEEMERVALGLLDGDIKPSDDAYSVLMRGIVQLPDYLERLQSGHRDIPVVLLPLLNDLRATRGEKLLSENVLFSPDLSESLPDSAAGPDQALPGDKLRAGAARLRLAFQFGLLRWFKDEDAEEILARLVAIADRLRSVTKEEEARRLWWVAGAVLDGLLVRGLEPSVSLKLLFGRVDREIKRLADEGEDVFRDSPPHDLTKSLLYYAAHAETDSRRIVELKTLYRLDELLPDASELEHARGSLSGHNRELLNTVSGAIKEDLLRVKDALDLHLRNEGAVPGDLAPLTDDLHRVADTLGMLGLGVPRKVVLEQMDLVGDITRGTREGDENTLLDVAGALLYVESSLDDHIEQLGGPQAGADKAAEAPIEDVTLELPQSEVRRILQALMREAATNLQQSKQDIIAFIEAPWDHDRVSETPRLLAEIVGALKMLNMHQPAKLLEGVVHFTTRELLEKRKVPSAEQLDTLADAVASIEYYLEAVRDQRSGRERILDVTRESLQKLGYTDLDQFDADAANDDALDISADEAALGTEEDTDQIEGLALELEAIPDEDAETADAVAEPIDEAEVEVSEDEAPAEDAFSFDSDLELEPLLDESADENDASDAAESNEAESSELDDKAEPEQEFSFDLEPLDDDDEDTLSLDDTDDEITLDSDDDDELSLEDLGDEVEEDDGPDTLEFTLDEIDDADSGDLSFDLSLDDDLVDELPADSALSLQDDTDSVDVDDSLELEDEQDTGVDIAVGEGLEDLIVGDSAEEAVEPGLEQAADELTVGDFDLESVAPESPDSDHDDDGLTLSEPSLGDEVDVDPLAEEDETAAAADVAENDAPPPEDRKPIIPPTVHAQPTTGGFEPPSDDIDDEIREVFVEEVTEEIENLNTLWPRWRSNTDDHETLTTIRRTFHTLKGSGRLVGALTIGEFSWKIENMLNRVLDRNIEASPAVMDVMKAAIAALPEMLAALQDGTPTTSDLEAIKDVAHRLSEGEDAWLPKEEKAAAETVELETDIPMDEGFADALDAHLEADGVETPPVEKAPEWMPEDADVETEQAASAEVEVPSVDPVLLEILDAEISNHLDVVREYLGDGQPTEPVGEVQVRAIHTLNGAISMAEVTPAAALTAPLEGYFKRLSWHQQAPSESGAALTIDVCTYLDEVIAALHGKGEWPDASELIAKVVDERDALAEPPSDVAVWGFEEPAESEPEAVDDAELAADADSDVGDDGDGDGEDEQIEVADTAGDAEAETDLDNESEGDDLDADQQSLSEALELDLDADEQSAPTEEQADADEQTVELDADDLADDLDLDDVLESDDDSAPESELDDWFDSDDAESTDEQQTPVDETEEGVEVADELSFAGDVEVEEIDIETAEQDEVAEDPFAEFSDEPASDAERDGDDTEDPFAEFDEGSSEDDVPEASEGADASAAAVEETDQDEQVEDDETSAVDDARNADEPADEASDQEASADTEQQESTEPEAAESTPATEAASNVFRLADADIDTELLHIFLEEGNEILDQTDNMMANWREQPDDSDLVSGLQRELHTLKGGARMAGLTPIGDLSHSMESLFEAIAEDRVSVNKTTIEVLETSFDRLHNMLEGIGEGSDIPAPNAVVMQLDGLIAGRTTKTPSEFGQAPDPGRFSPAVSRTTALDEQQARGGVGRQAEVIRVRSDLLDNLVNFAGEVSIYRSRLEQQIGSFRFNLVEFEQTVDRLREQLRKLELETEAQILSRFQREAEDHDVDFDPLELDRFSQLQQLSRALAESVSDLVSIQNMMDDLTRQSETLLLQQSRVNSELQEGLMRTRMVPFESLVPRLRRVLRQTAAELNKKAQLRVVGAQGEMDRTVLDRITAPLEHMLRNAVAHGLESPEQRLANGKREEGEIRIAVSREATEVVLEVSDDGSGIDRSVVRETAIKRGLLLEDVEIGDRDLDRFILETGFSTATEVTKVSGRGVGMDVVNNEIKQLGGAIDIESTPGQGTVFSVRLPFTLAVTHSIMARVGEHQFAIPLSSIEGVVRMSRKEFEQRVETGNMEYAYAGETFNIHELNVLLGMPAEILTDDDRIPLLIARLGDQRAAVRVDAVLGNREVVVKSVSPQVSSIPGIFGATILGDGSVIVIVDLGPLVRRGMAKHLSTAADIEVAPEPEVAEVAVVPERQPLIMVVDDSITMRKVTTRVLERHDFEVVTAKDGVDAVQQLQERVPDVMLLDIEMPRMDGYELATHMRNDSRLKDVPIIMITSRTGEKHRQRAMEIGVDRYLGKPYQEADLLENVNDLLGRDGEN